MAARKFALGQLTVSGVRPVELVDIAAQAGYNAISPVLAANGGFGLPDSPTPLKAGDPQTVAMARRMAETGVSVHIGDGFALYDGVPMAELREGVDLMKSLGARAIGTIQFDSDESRGFDRFCQLREWALQAGLITLIEFTPLSRIAGLREALEYAKRAGDTGIQILIDVLHLYRSGGQAADVADIPMSSIGGVQLCDGALEPSRDGYSHEAMYERRIPGAGMMNLRELLGYLPPDLIVDVEVPSRSLAQSGVSRLTRASRVLEASRSLA